MKLFEKIYPIGTAIIIVLLVVYLSPTDLTGRFDHKKAMAALDLNEDNQLDLNEIEKIQSLIEGVNPSDNIPLNDLGSEHRDVFRVIDIDKDGFLSTEEKSNALRNLQNLDEDQDGFVSLKELK